MVKYRKRLLIRVSSIFMIVISLVGISISSLWILLYAYIGLVSVFHGEGGAFISDVSRENTPIFFIAAILMLVMSSLIFVSFIRLLRAS